MAFADIMEKLSAIDTKYYIYGGIVLCVLIVSWVFIRRKGKDKEEE